MNCHSRTKSSLRHVHLALQWSVMIVLLAAAFVGRANDAQREIPAVLGSQFSFNSAGKLQLKADGQTFTDIGNTDKYNLAQMLGDPKGAATGIAFDFHDEGLNGSISYGTYNDSSEFPTILFLPHPVELKGGRALLEIKKTFTSTSNDFSHLAEKGAGILGFRVMNSSGHILYEGRVAFTGKGPYTVQPTIVEGPLVNLLEPTGATISFETQVPVLASIEVNGKSYADNQTSLHHEIALTGLAPETLYTYSVHYGDRTDAHSFRTALPKGSRKSFSFAFVADNRAVKAGGERDFGEVNYQTTRAGMASAVMHKAAFLQAMGGNTTGNNPSVAGHVLEHANWKRALEPFWASVPVYAGMGNHESNYYILAPEAGTTKPVRIARFPYDTEAGEVAFAKAFVQPTNGPESEDGASYDPSRNAGDFPSYKENVYYYTYGNLAMVVLNSEYWKSTDPMANGAPEGYVMDQQLKWLAETVQKLDADPAIDHIFVATHSAMFPSGDHTDAGMWFFGNNDPRPMIKGVRSSRGIIERRDQLIDVSVNRSKKVIGFLTGSEHNFSILQVTADLAIYPDHYSAQKLRINRPFFVINNGGGGAYSYAMMNDARYHTPWIDHFQYFAAPASMALFAVNGASVSLSAYNPETFETIAKDVKLR